MCRRRGRTYRLMQLPLWVSLPQLIHHILPLACVSAAAPCLLSLSFIISCCQLRHTSSPTFAPGLFFPLAPGTLGSLSLTACPCREPHHVHRKVCPLRGAVSHPPLPDLHRGQRPPAGAQREDHLDQGPPQLASLAHGWLRWRGPDGERAGRGAQAMGGGTTLWGPDQEREGVRGKDGGGLVGTGSPPSLPPNAKHCVGLLLNPRVLS